MKKKSQLLEGLRNIKIRLVLKLKESKDLLSRGDNLQKTTFAIIATANHFSRNCPRNNLPGRYQNVNKVEKSNPDTSDDILEEQDTSSSEADLEIDYVKEKKKPKPSHVKSKKKRRNIYQIVEEQGEQINSISAKLSEICNLSSQLSEMMSTVSRRKGEVNTLGETSVFPPDIEDINRECNDDVFVFFIGSLLCCNELNENPEKYAFLGYIRAMKSGS